MPPAGKITGPAAARKKLAPKAAKSAEAIFAPQLEQVDAEASNRTRNLGLFNAAILEAMAPFIERARVNNQAGGNFGAGFGGANSGLMGAQAKNNQASAFATSDFLNQQPFFTAEQANLERALIESEAEKGRRQIRSDQAATQEDILRSMVDQLFNVQTQRFAQDLARDEFGEAKKNNKSQRQLAKRRANLDERIQGFNEAQAKFANELALKEFGLEVEDLNFSQRLAIAKATETDGPQPKNKKAKRKKTILALTGDINEFAIDQWNNFIDTSETGTTEEESASSGGGGSTVVDPSDDSGAIPVGGADVSAGGSSSGKSGSKKKKTTKSSGKKRNVQNALDLARRVNANFATRVNALNLPLARRRNILRNAVLTATGIKLTDRALNNVLGAKNKTSVAPVAGGPNTGV